MHSTHSRSQPSQHVQGFSLLELSIALVIIGLIIGGVLVGRNLISAAQVNAGIHQTEGYQSAVNNFRLRFRGVPGDLATATTQFSSTKWPQLTNGDGNGILRDSTGAIDPTAYAPADLADAYETEIDTFTGELPQFWYQLSAAGMVDAQFDNGYTLGESFPASKAGNGGIVAYGISEESNYFYIGMVTPTDTASKAILTKNALTPEEAYKMDQKIDDGHPLRGSVRAKGGSDFFGNYVFHNIAALDNPALPTSIALALQQAGNWIIPAAHATATTVSRDACVFKIAAEGDDSAHYAVAAGGVNCQLKIRWN